MDFETAYTERADPTGKGLREVVAKISQLDREAVLAIGERAMDSYLAAVTGVVSARTRRVSAGQRRLRDHRVA